LAWFGIYFPESVFISCDIFSQCPFKAIMYLYAMLHFQVLEGILKNENYFFRFVFVHAENCFYICTRLKRQGLLGKRKKRVSVGAPSFCKCVTVLIRLR